MTSRLLLTSLLLGACSTVAVPEGRFECTTAATCPEGWSCHSDRLCYSTAEVVADAGYDATDGMAGSSETAGAGGDSGTGGGGTGGSETDAAVDSGTPCTFDGPHNDYCDGRDNDCDGTVDEGQLIDSVNRDLGCPFVNEVNPVCVAGACSYDPRLSTCRSGWLDCDGAPDNGCEGYTWFCIVDTSGGCTNPPGARRDCDGCEYILPMLYTGRRVQLVQGQDNMFEYVDDPGCPQG